MKNILINNLFIVKCALSYQKLKEIQLNIFIVFFVDMMMFSSY